MDYLITPIRVSGVDSISITPVDDDFDYNIEDNIVELTFNNGELQCCQMGIVTNGLTMGDARFDAALGVWRLLETPVGGDYPDASTNRTYEGSVSFGVCCVTGLEFDIMGQIETLNSGYDFLSIALNGVEQYYKQSSADGLGDSTANIGFSDTYVMPITPKPCGNIVTLTASTVDEFANNDIYWQVGITPL